MAVTTMYKWPLRTDVLSCWKPYLCFVAYLAFLSLVPGFSHTTVGGQGGELFASNRCYLYLQFIACFFVVGTAASLFEETFRTTSRQYIRTLPLGTVRVILARYIKLLLFVLIPYVPTVLFMFIRANASLQDYFLLFPQESACPPIPLLFPYRCLARRGPYGFITHIPRSVRRPCRCCCVVVGAYHGYGGARCCRFHFGGRGFCCCGLCSRRSLGGHGEPSHS